MTLKNLVGNIQVFADDTHFVFEQFAQRLNQFQIHLFRQTADIVMRFYCHRRSAQRDGFDNVRVKRALHEIFDIADLLRFGVEHLDEFAPDCLAFLFRLGDVF